MSDKQILASNYAKKQCSYYHENSCVNTPDTSCVWYRLFMYEERKEAIVKGLEAMKQKAVGELIRSGESIY